MDMLTRNRETRQDGLTNERRKYPRKMAASWGLLHNTPALAKKLIQELHEKNGSDLHLTPDDNCYNLAIRKNGVLESIFSVTVKAGRELTNHWKVQANLDLTLSHKPQDGSILNSRTGDLSYRVSTCPTLFGEKVVIRLHATSLSALAVNQLGMTSSQLSHYLRAIQNSSGLVLVSGPTGSGKTNTIYAALNHLQKQSISIVSVEDPVEVNLPGVTQINTNEAFGYSQALRTILRQDPNVIMIGEIRDSETAKIAVSAAQTGHLVFASVHAGDSHSALLRLQDLGVDLAELIPQLLLLSSQQLIRTTGDNQDSADEERYGKRRGIFDIIACTAPVRQQLLTSLREGMLAQSLTDYLQKESNYSDTILTNMIHNNETDWTEIQRVYGWEKVAKLSALNSDSTAC
jgi:type II secretory ATPase GspE/PulE/Tfp pilus assembly ATPase PilB-like protein